MIEYKHLREKTYEGELVNLSQYTTVCNCYFKDCDIILRDKYGLCNIAYEGFQNVVFDDCRIKSGKIGAHLLCRNEPTLFKNTKVDILSRNLATDFFRAFYTQTISDECKYYMSKYWSGCTINGEPIKELNSSEYEDKFAAFDEQLPKFSKKNESDKYEKQLSVLNAIEETSGVDMGFQKGMLDVEFGKRIIVKNPNDENYSSYDAGLEYALRERGNMISKFTNAQDDNKSTKK